MTLPHKLTHALALVVIAATIGSQPVTASAKTAPTAQAKQQMFESFTVNKDANLEVLQVMNGNRSDLQGQIVKLSKGSEITVIETDNDPNLGDLIRIGVDSDDDSSTGPNDFWVRASDLMKAGLEQSEMMTNNEDPVLSPMDLGHDSIFGLDDIASAKRLAKRRMTYCYRFVKQYLLSHHMVPVYLPGGSAWMAASILPRYGFKRTGHTPQTAGLNEVCVYRGGRGGNGHIEIRLPGGWWYGYGYHGPISRVNHPFIACFKK